MLTSFDILSEWVCSNSEKLKNKAKRITITKKNNNSNNLKI